METQVMIDVVCGEIKRKLNAFCANADLERLTPQAAEQMSRALSSALVVWRDIAPFSASMSVRETRLSVTGK